MLQQQRRSRRPADQRHYIDSRTPWLQIFADEMRERMRTINERCPMVEEFFEDFIDQFEEAERLFSGVPKDWGNEWSEVDDDPQPYADTIEM